MTHQYESEILNKLMERDGFNIPSSVPPYEAEIKAYLINQVKQAYPKLTDYEAEWLLYNYTKHLPADFPISSVSNVTDASFENVVPFAYQSATLKGSTKYRDIDTGDILDTFDETKNLELVSVKVPVLTTIGKNLFNMSEIVISDFEKNKYQNGYYGKEIQLQPNTSYTIKPYLTSEITNTNVWTVFNLIVNDVKTEVVNANYTGSGIDKKAWNTQTFRTDETGVIGYSIYVNRDKEESWFGNLPIEVQLEEGSTATPYEPFKSNILSTPSDLELRGIGDGSSRVEDELNCLTGEVTENFEPFVFNGSENWVLNDDTFENTTMFILSSYAPNMVANQSVGICNNFVWGNYNKDFPGIMITKPSGHVYLRTPKMSVAELKTTLSNNHIHGYYNKEKSVKTVDLKTVNESGESVHFMPIEGTMYVQSSGEIIQPTFDMAVPVEATTQNLASFIDLEMEE